MSTKFLMTRDIAGYNGFGILPTTDMQSGLLATSTAQSITVPDNYPYWIAIFSYTPGASVWVSFTTTAAAPSGSFAASASCLNPAARAVKAGDTISMLTADSFDVLVSVEFPLGLGIINNPLLDSPFIQDSFTGNVQPPGSSESILTEDDAFILTESGDFIATE